MEKITREDSAWDHSRSEISEFTDLLGHPIENGVLNALVGMNLLGLHTSSSCEGHNINGQFQAPYIQGEAKDMPFYRFVGQQEFTERFLEEHGLNDVAEIYADDTLIDKYDDLIYDELLPNNEEETEKYKQWSAENNQLKMRVQDLIQDYVLSENESGRVPKIMLQGVYPAYRIVFGNPSTHDVEQKLTEAQLELDRFTEYLKRVVN